MTDLLAHFAVLAASDQRPFFHGSADDLSPGELLSAERAEHAHGSSSGEHVYMTRDKVGAAAYGLLKVDRSQGRPRARVYEVDPSGDAEPDPNHPGEDAWRSSSATVVREVPWSEIQNRTAAARPGRGEERCSCCRATGEHEDRSECDRCDGSGMMHRGDDATLPWCPGREQDQPAPPRRRHWREAAHPGYGPEPEFKMAPEDWPRDRQTAYHEQQFDADREWKRKMRYGLSVGHLSLGEARGLGYYPLGHEKEDERSRRPSGWQPLPQDMYHVTTNLAGVREHGGLRSRRELQQESGGAGLGGGDDETISLTTDRGMAHHILRALHEYHGFLNHGDPRDLMERARRGDQGSKPFHDELVRQYNGDWKPGDPVPRHLDAIVRGKKIKNELASQEEMPGWTVHRDSAHLGRDKQLHNLWERDATPEERMHDKSDLYKYYSAWRQHAGGPEDPLFMGNDPHRLASMDPHQFALLHVRPRPGAQGYPLSSMGEWRTHTGDALDVHHAERVDEQGRYHEAARKDPFHGEGPWYHGTPEELELGDVIVPGDVIGKQNMGRGSDSARAWVTNDPWKAASYGPNIYEVAPSVRPKSMYARHHEHYLPDGGTAAVIRRVPYEEATALSPEYQRGRKIMERQVREHRRQQREAMAEDYFMSHRPLRDGAPAHDLTEAYAEDIYTHPQHWAGTWPDRASAEGLSQLRRARGKPDAPVTIYRASPPDAPLRMHAGDWVSLSRTYAEQHAWAHEEYGPSWKVHKAEVPAKHVRDAGTDQYREQGYWGPDVDSEEVPYRRPAEGVLKTGKYETHPEYPEGPELEDHIRHAHGWDPLDQDDLGEEGYASNRDFHDELHEMDRQGDPDAEPTVVHDHREDTRCKDCGTETLSSRPREPTEWYMVHDHVWGQAGSPHGHLCVGCLEKRLGRKLNKTDFQPGLGVNDPDREENPRYAWSYRTERLKDRLRREPDEGGRHQAARMPEASGRENVRHVLDHYLPSDFGTWDEVRDNFNWDHPAMRAFVEDVRRNGVQRPVPIDYEQDPPRVMNGHKRVLAAELASREDVPVRQHEGFMDPDDPDPYGRGPDDPEHWTNRWEREGARYEPGIPNPHTGGQDWFHGTQADPVDLHQGGFADQPDTYFSREEEDLRAVHNHWNALIGPHFAASHKMADHFAEQGASSKFSDEGDYEDFEDPYREDVSRGIVHARLHLRNPKVYASEHDMDHEAYEHEHGQRKNYIDNYLREAQESGVDEYGEGYSEDTKKQEGDSRHAIERDEGTYNRATRKVHPERTTWLNVHPDKAGIARRFRERLEAQGHDGIIYRNEYENQDEPGPYAQHSAIPFRSHQVEITDHHALHAPERTPEEASAERGRLPQRGQEMLPGMWERGERMPRVGAMDMQQKLFDMPHIKPVPAHEARPWYHGTRYKLRSDQLLEGGKYNMNQGYGGTPGEHVYYSGRPDIAAEFAEEAYGPDRDMDARPRVYQVQPDSSHEADPLEHPDVDAWRALRARVVREVPWSQALRGRIARLGRLGDDDFRRTLSTTPRGQLVRMMLKPGEEIGAETHDDGDQHFVVVRGQGRGQFDDGSYELTEGDTLSVPMGVRHNVVNTGPGPLHLVTFYAPPQHPPGTVHHTKADAIRAEGAWLPTHRIFGPTYGLDHRLFDEHEHMRPEVRAAILKRLSPVMNDVLGRGWRDYASVYLAGSEASKWTSPQLEGNSDLDVLVGLLHQGGHAGADGDAGEQGAEDPEALNRAFWDRFNDESWDGLPGGPWHLTAFCNPRAYDIRAIRPYAAYDLLRDDWAVKPPDLPEWSAASFEQGPALFQMGRALGAELRAVFRLPEPFRSQEARRLWAYIKSGRDADFNEGGAGVFGTGNVLEKFIDQMPGHLIDRLKTLAHGDSGGPFALGQGMTTEDLEAVHA